VLNDVDKRINSFAFAEDLDKALAKGYDVKKELSDDAYKIPYG
jgi:hypothetical protein